MSVYDQDGFSAKRGRCMAALLVIMWIPCAPRSWSAGLEPLRPLATEAPATAAPAPASCPTSLASLDGWFAMLVSGQTTGSSPAAKYLAGALLSNGAGTVTADHVYDGTGAAATATGFYAVNSDCTLTLTLSIGASAPQVYALAVDAAGGAVGIETDATAVATIDLRAQYASITTGRDFTNASLNGTFAASCIGPGALASDLNLASFSNGTVNGTDPYNDAGGFAVANVPYAGTYAVNSDGTFSGTLTVLATPFDFYGVISAAGGEIEYLYSNVAKGAPTGAFAACHGGIALAPTPPSFTLAPASRTLQLAANSGGTDAIIITDGAGFGGTVSLTESGVPTGASSAFVGSTLVVFVAGTAHAGTYPLTVTGTSGGVTASTTVSLVVTPERDFTLKAAPASLSLAAGTSANTNISVAPQNGFASSVAFSAAGLPSGATATFAPASSTSGTTLRLTTAAGTPAGTYTLTVTGTAAATPISNAVSATTRIQLTVARH